MAQMTWPPAPRPPSPREACMLLKPRRRATDTMADLLGGMQGRGLAILLITEQACCLLSITTGGSMQLITRFSFWASFVHSEQAKKLSALNSWLRG